MTAPTPTSAILHALASEPGTKDEILARIGAAVSSYALGIHLEAAWRSGLVSWVLAPRPRKGRLWSLTEKGWTRITKRPPGLHERDVAPEVEA